MSAVLPATPRLYPGQALDSYLEHLADANFLTTGQLGNLLGLVAGDTNGPAVAPHPHTLAAIAAASGLPTRRLQAATLAGTQPAIAWDALNRGKQHAHRQLLATGWVRIHATRLCPACLADNGAWLVTWRIPAVTACTTHRLILAHQCPRCERPFRDARHSPLRPVGAALVCGNPLGQGPRSQCQQPLTQIRTQHASDSALHVQVRIDTALNGANVQVLGHPASPDTYLEDLRALTSVLLHLARQPAAQTLAPWASQLETFAARQTYIRGPRWALKPPTDPGTLAGALASADHILAARDLETAVTRFAAWYDLTPATNESRLDWLIDRTRPTHTTARILLATHAPRRRLSRRLDDGRPLLPIAAVPQAVPARPYEAHLAPSLACTPDIGRVYAAVCLARTHPQATTWEEAATLIDLPPRTGTRIVRTVNQRAPASPEAIHTAIQAVAAAMDPRIRWRARQATIRRDATDAPSWFPAWAAEHKPGARASSAPYALTWRWIHHAGGILDTSPAWPAPPTSRQRAAYRQFVTTIRTG